jgi:Uma2 family endonuclease
VDGEYELRLFCGDDWVVSSLLPELGLTAAQVLMTNDCIER